MNVCILWKLYFNRIDISEVAEVDKTSASKEFYICHYWFYLNYSFKFQQKFCNRPHDLWMMSMNISDIAILNIKGYKRYSLISKNEI